MSRRRARSAASLAALLGLAASACGGDAGPPTDTTITQVGDTTIVVPALDGPTGRLVSDLVIGLDESNTEAVFGWIRDAALGPDGSIYVLDAQAERVARFAPDGSYEGEIARRGEGPGEVQSPAILAVSDAGRIAVGAVGEVEVFDTTGEPLATQRLINVIPPLGFDGETALRLHTGTVALPSRGASWRAAGNGIQSVDVVRDIGNGAYALQTAGLDGSTEPTSDAPFGLDDLFCIVPEGSGDARVCIDIVFGDVPWFDWLPDGRLVSGRTGDYRIDVRESSGPGVTSIRPAREPVPLESGLRDLLGAGRSGIGVVPDSVLEVPTHKPAHDGVVVARDGTLWVRLHAPSERTVEDEDTEVWIETESRFDLFSPEGEHLGYVTGPADRTLRDVVGDTLLTTGAGDFGIPIVERFIVDWSTSN